MGSVFATVVNRIFPAAHLSPGAYALVAMAAVFGAASRATFALMVFAFEITRDYNAILPLMLGCVIADLIALRYLPSSIMTEKLVRRGLRVPEEIEAGVLKVVRVGEVMRKDVQPIPEDTTIGELVERTRGGRSSAAAQGSQPVLDLTQGLPIVGKDGRLAGVVTQGDLLRALERDPSGKLTVLEAGAAAPIVAYPDELAHDALLRMLQNDIGRLPVVSREDPLIMVGYFDRTSLLGSWSHHIEQENLREHGWLRQWGTNLAPARARLEKEKGGPDS